MVGFPPVLRRFRIRCKWCGRIIERINVYRPGEGPGSRLFTLQAFDAQQDHRGECPSRPIPCAY